MSHRSASPSTVHLVGAGGQLGRALLTRIPDGFRVVAHPRGRLDVTDAGSVRAALAELAPGDVVLNAAAYTDVDGAESDRERAFAVNADGPAHLAAVTARTGARLIHVSTDYVFTPEAGRDRPFEPDEVDPAAAPATVYGASKLAGERAARAADPASIIVRTAWVYTGGPADADFVGTMRRLERSRPEISVVDDQRGSPTYAGDLARGLWALAGRAAAPDYQAAGAVLHAAGAGEATWYELARAVFRGVGADPDRVRPCTTREFPRPAPRPAYSVLSGRSWRAADLPPLRDWRAALTDALAGR